MLRRSPWLKPEKEHYMYKKYTTTTQLLKTEKTSQSIWYVVFKKNILHWIEKSNVPLQSKKNMTCSSVDINVILEWNTSIMYSVILTNLPLVARHSFLRSGQWVNNQTATIGGPRVANEGHEGQGAPGGPPVCLH
jgi:hypothetical protein